MSRSLALCALALAACQQPFDRRPSQVDGQRILAVRAEPAEAPVGTAVTVSALLVAPEGEQAAAPSAAFCLLNRPAADDNTVADQCLEAGASALRSLSAALTGPLPLEGCQRFGSEPSPPAPGEPAVRPQDPDATGGYYQPVRVEWPGGGPLAFGQVRLSCALASAPAAVVQEFRARYRANQNPRLLHLAVPATLGPGERIDLTAAWSDDSAEPYVVYDLASVSLVERVERLRISWFSTAGTLAADEGAEASMGFTAPTEPGTVHVWAVLRDDRGGSDWLHAVVEVR